MLVDQVAQRNAHRFFDRARLLHVAGNAEQLRAGIVRPPDAGEPGRTAAQDIGHHRDRLDIVDRGRAAVEADIGRERRLAARLPFLPSSFRAAPSPRRRYRRRRRDARRGRSRKPWMLFSPMSRPRRPDPWPPAGARARGRIRRGRRCSRCWRSWRSRRSGSLDQRCGSCRMISRSLQVPGSDLSALTTR